jgi:hypothetical protein
MLYVPSIASRYGELKADASLFVEKASFQAVTFCSKRGSRFALRVL